MRIKTLLLSLLLGISSYAQQEFTLSGVVEDASSGEDIAFGNVIVGPTQGVNTNMRGFYSIRLPEGEYTVRFSSIGYETLEQTIVLNADKRVDVELKPAVEILDAAEIVDVSESENLDRNVGSMDKVDMRDLPAFPIIGGERDPMKILESKPGFKSAGEGNSGFYVRGGGLDQNLILLDEAPVYNPSHLLGFFSVFNGDAIKGIEAYKGGMSAEYGGRTSSVIDVSMRDGNSKKMNISGGIGLISSRLTLEAPIVKDKGSFIISGRRTYADLFLGLSSNDAVSNSQLFFYDLNLKANYEITDKDRVFLSGYFGRDRFGFDDSFGLNWGNATATARWNHIFDGDRWFMNSTFIYSDYDYEFQVGEDEDRIALQSVINDINFKQDFTHFASPRSTWKFGYNLIDHTIEPGNLDAGENTGINNRNAEVKHGLEGALFVQHDWKPLEKLSLNYGLRYSMFQQRGPGTEYYFDSEGVVTGTEEIASGNPGVWYDGFEPRLAANYKVNSVSSVKLGLNRNYQYIHLLSNATSSTPTDVWVMSTNNIKPQSADQLSLGYFRNFKENTYEVSVEGYYKLMDNVIDYRTGANLLFNDELEGDLVNGDGEAYGVEFMVKKSKGKLTGWVTYTLSRTLRNFDDIDNGETFSARQDRIHDVSLVMEYALNDKLSLGANFVYYTGDAVTFPEGRYTIDGQVVPYYTSRNGYRMPDYHRLDLALNWKRKSTEKFESSWNFSIYNVYGRENAYSIDFRASEDNPNVTEAVQLSLFKMVPSFTYNFKFK